MRKLVVTSRRWERVKSGKLDNYSGPKLRRFVKGQFVL